MTFRLTVATFSSLRNNLKRMDFRSHLLFLMRNALVKCALYTVNLYIGTGVVLNISVFLSIGLLTIISS
jgi:hypothetical protein